MEPSVRRVGIVVGAFAAVAFVAGAFVLDGYNAARTTASVDNAAANATATAAPSVVYVRPPASPQVINVTQTASPAPPQVIKQVVPGGGENESEGEDGD